MATTIGANFAVYEIEKANGESVYLDVDCFDSWNTKRSVISLLNR